jgi:hypothetical protein
MMVSGNHPRPAIAASQTRTKRRPVGAGQDLSIPSYLDRRGVGPKMGNGSDVVPTLTKGRFTGLTGAPFSIRITPELRDQLDAAIAKNGNSMTQEILDRLEWSFEEDAKIGRDPAGQSLLFLVGHTIDRVQAITQRDWRNDLFTWQAIKEAVNGLLIPLEPGGELIPLPPEFAKRFGPEIAKQFSDDPTPPYIGGFVTAMILFEFWGGGSPTPKNAKEYAILASLKAARRNMRPKQDQRWPPKEEKGQ